MNVVSVTSVTIHDNPAKFTDPFKFEITFEANANLAEDLEWKIIYVGSAKDQRYDQELESVLIGPVAAGVNKFVLQTPPPDPTKIPPEDLIGVTALLIVASYKNQEFTRVGYYVSNETPEEQQDGNQPGQLSGDIPATQRMVNHEQAQQAQQQQSDPLQGQQQQADSQQQQQESQTEQLPKEAESEAQENVEEQQKIVRKIPPEEIIRKVLCEQPRVTVRAIKWDNEDFDQFAIPESEAVDPKDEAEVVDDLSDLDDLASGDNETEDNESTADENTREATEDEQSTPMIEANGADQEEPSAKKQKVDIPSM